MTVTALAADEWPAVSVVMPVRNEAVGLRDALVAVAAQQYPGRCEVVVAVGPSDDGTEALADQLAGELTTDAVTIRTVANRAGTTPAGLNAAIDASTGDVIVRVDGHCRLSAGYIELAVEVLRATGAVNVGGVQMAVGTTPFERAVATAMTSRFGVGDAIFHHGGAAGPTDTVYLGVFDRAALEAAGCYDQSLVRNQDYELNIRLRDNGGVVWFDPRLEVEYRPRGSLRALARQYFDYGRWKRRVVALHPRSLRWRQALPPLTAVAITGGLAASVIDRRTLAAPVGYLAAVVGAAAVAGVTASERCRLVAIFPTMHLSWGVGFLRGGAK